MKNPFEKVQTAIKNMMEPEKPVAPEKPKEATREERKELNKKKSPIKEKVSGGGYEKRSRWDRVVDRTPEEVKRKKNRKANRIKKQSRITNRTH